MSRGEKTRSGGPGWVRDDRRGHPSGGSHEKSRQDYSGKQAGRRSSQALDNRQEPENHPRGARRGQESKPPRTNEKKFDIVVDSVPYIIKVTRFLFNGEARYNVSFNGSTEHVFTWDSSLGQLRAIDDDSSSMPDNLEMAISEKLQSKI